MRAVSFLGPGVGIIAMRDVSFLGPGAGIIAMRDVSFLGPGNEVKGGNGGGIAATGGAFGATGIGGGGGISGGSTMDSAMGGAWRGESSGSAIDGTGNEGGFGGCPNPGSTGARAVGNGGGLGGFRVWVVPDELLGARDGRLILIVSRGPLFEGDALPACRGGSLIRTVSFLGSLASAIASSSRESGNCDFYLSVILPSHVNCEALRTT